MKILGLSAFYHDSAATLIEDGNIIAAAQQERFSRRKHDPGFPADAIQYCLNAGKIKLDDLNHIVFYDKPFLKFERLLETYLSFAPRGFRSFAKSMPVWLKEKLFQRKLLGDALAEMGGTKSWQEKLLFAEHHQSHAASAYYPSPFNDAIVLTMDGVGEWATTSVAIGNGSKLDFIKEIHFPHSLGLLYSAFTYYTGFKVNSGEYKVMGLAPYGEPKYKSLILKHLIDVKADGSYRLNLEYFDYCTGLTMTNRRFDKLFGAPPRLPDQPLTQKHMDLAASIQAVTEEVVLRMTRSLAKEYKVPNLCLAGGVALNCVANGKILKAGHFKAIWAQPAAGDAGGALGAALAVHYQHLSRERPVAKGAKDQMQGSYLGPRFEQQDIENRLRHLGAKFQVCTDAELIQQTADQLADSKVVGWFQGRMEFGPRALGGRSILGDPRSPAMQSQLNLKIKYRESFRPFAPSVLAESVAEWFELYSASPYMLLVANVCEEKRLSADDTGAIGVEKLKVPRSQVPAVTHVDFSARIQTVHADTNPRYHQLIEAFRDKTGCPMLVNTSFNVRGEPIVCTPEDAYRCFMGTDMDTLSIGNCFLEKALQPREKRLDYKNAFALD